MIDATPPCPIMIYEIKKKDNLFVVNQLCLLEDPRYDYIGAGEQRWISNEIISELVNNVVAAHEVGSSAGSTALRGISVTPTFRRIISFHDDRCYLIMSYHDLRDQSRQIVGYRFALFVGDRIRDKIVSELVNNVGLAISRRALCLLLVDGP